MFTSSRNATLFLFFFAYSTISAIIIYIGDIMKEKFNQSEYIKQYNKDNYIQKKFYLRKDEKEKLDQVLKKENETLKNYLMKKVEKDLKNY